MTELVDYISKISENSRDSVVESIMKARIIRKAMDTETGKALFNSAIDGIHRNIMTIVGSCTDSEDVQVEKIKKCATEVHVAYNMMKDWATIIKEGDKHEVAMKKE